MLAKVITVYLTALFVCGVFATLLPPRATAKAATRAHRTALRVAPRIESRIGPFSDNAKARVDQAILRDHLAAPEDRNNDGIESDVRDQMKYRPLSSPLT